MGARGRTLPRRGIWPTPVRGCLLTILLSAVLPRVCDFRAALALKLMGWPVLISGMRLPCRNFGGEGFAVASRFPVHQPAHSSH